MDGPISTRDYLTCVHENVWKPRKFKFNEHKFQREKESCVPECVERVNKITDKTGAYIVLSSAWRGSFTTEECREMLKECGFTGHVIGRTGRCPEGTRKNEIQEYLDNCPYNVVSYVSIDDDYDSSPDPNKMIREIYYQGDVQGIQDKHVDIAIQILNEKD